MPELCSLVFCNWNLKFQLKCCQLQMPQFDQTSVNGNLGTNATMHQAIQLLSPAGALIPTPLPLSLCLSLSRHCSITMSMTSCCAFSTPAADKALKRAKALPWICSRCTFSLLFYVRVYRLQQPRHPLGPLDPATRAHITPRSWQSFALATTSSICCCCCCWSLGRKNIQKRFIDFRFAALQNNGIFMLHVKCNNNNNSKRLSHDRT